jgi:hypothetical protein
MPLLLDFDGIILQNPRIEKMITHKSIKFIMKKNRLSYEQSQKINDDMYPKLGHTSLLLSNTRSYQTNVVEYNNYVFEEMDYDMLIKPLLTVDDFYHIQRILDCRVELGLFTNAPITWVDGILGCLGFSTEDMFNQSLLFTSDDGDIKPLAQTYQKVNECMLNRMTTFIDDKQQNLEPAESFTNWACIHIRSGDKDKLIQSIKKYGVCRSVEHFDKN